ncbi:MAG: hypothetical protein E6G56_13290 [Actinobacteria bacterium]|nr:MAG: hypothetical protein E6G56_13290 [Actinomycetota bacterium]
MASPGLDTVVQDDGQLLHRSPAQVQAMMAQLRFLGVDTVRLTADWSQLAPRAHSRRTPRFRATDPGAYPEARWAGLDAAVRAATGERLRVMIDIGFWAPRWAGRAPGPRERTHIDARAYARFAVAVARRFNGRFTPGGARQALPEVNTFALWNEPNHPTFLMPQWRRGGSDRGSGSQPASADDYRAMVQAAYPSVKRVRPRTVILIGNTSSRGGRPPRGPVAPLAFVRALACVDSGYRPVRTGTCSHFARVPGDGFAHHPYSLLGAPDSRGHHGDVLLGNLGELEACLSRLVRMGRLAPGLRDLYLTELGYETHRLPHHPRISEATQARYLTWSEYLAWRVPRVRMFAQFLLRDQPAAKTVRSDSPLRPYGQFYSGLERADGSAKPGLWSFMAGLFAQRAPAGEVLLWGRLRLAVASAEVAIQRRLPGQAWETIGTTSEGGGDAPTSFVVGGHDAFERFTGFVRGASYRLALRRPDGAWAAGLAVPVVESR